MIHRGESHAVVGHVDHWSDVEFAGGSVPLGAAAPAGGGEFLVKAKAPVRKGLADELRSVCGAAVHAARNTWLAQCRDGALALAVDGVVGVIPVTDAVARTVKVQRHIHNRTARHPDTLRDELHIDLYPHADGNAAARDLAPLLPAGAELDVAGSMLAVRCGGCADGWSADAADAAVLPSRGFGPGRVLHVEHPMKMRLQNRWVRGIISSGRYTEHSSDEPFAFLDGEGSVVGCADTGIDSDHCFFRDPHRPIPYDKPDMEHRKIVYYGTNGARSSGARRDTHEGHGTHIAGTIVGACAEDAADTERRFGAMTSKVSQYHGFLKKAKIAFLDMHPWDDDREGVSPPQNLYQGLLLPLYKVGARVNSNSWGGLSAQYTGGARYVDSFQHENRDSVPVFAAGNDADVACESNPSDPKCDKFTVISPCTAKNAICVGASQAPLVSWEAFGEGNYLLTVGGRQFSMTRGSFGPENPPLPRDADLRAAVPADGCRGSVPEVGFLSNTAELRGAVVLVDRGTCYFTAKARAAADAGAAALLVINNVAGDAILMGNQEPPVEVGIPAFMISQDDGASVRSLLAAGRATVSMQRSAKQDPHKSADNLSVFSSRGPTADLRMKPDVVGVGEYVHSAWSDGDLTTNNCDIFAAMGTSMATPQVSSAAEMVRQWLMQGYYPTGERSKDKRWDAPAGALVKAIIVQSAVPLTGIVDRNGRGDWEAFGETPNFYQGHGIVRLNSTLGHPGHPLPLFAADGPGLHTGDTARYCVRFGGSEHGFRATLVWSDPPAHSGSKFTLINDLDLVVTAPDGRQYRGNAKPAHADMRDALNNVEKVRLPRAPPGVYTIEVAGWNVMEGAQDFAVVASGAEESECDTCPNQCGSNGRCVDGGCKCDPLYWGASCSERLRTLASPGDVGEVSLPVWGWRVWAVEVPLRSVTVTARRLDGDSDVNVFVRGGAVPDFRHYDARDNGKGDSVTVSHSWSGAAGTVYIAVHAGCCSASRFTLDVRWS